MPNSILWIGLVVLWVFVLFPILADRHPRIRQTTDAALATRVLHRGGSKRRMKKGPAAGHDSDPDYRPTRVQRKRFYSDDAEDRMSAPADEQVTEVDEDKDARDDIPALEAGPAASAADSGNADDEPAEADSGEPDDEVTSEADRTEDPDSELDADLDSDENDTDTARTPADADAAADDDDVAYDGEEADSDEEDRAHHEPATARIPPARSAAPARVPDSEFETDSAETEFVPTRRGRGGFDPEADAIARAARYTFRQRAVLGLLLSSILCGALALVISPLLWWACALFVLGLGTYLAYLRRQVRMEEEIRRSRAARLTRGRDDIEGDQHRADDTATRRGMDRDTARALRRRSVLLDADDEDPMFEHLDTFDPAAARALRGRTGTDMRRAVGE
ncbi:divisome protein SepX/GlpR [Nocardia lijiangensis]|uniref:divisome protein SepX/GlpR n=1 Tax=Nocardia lijiangensis TaxID=299618 RepID=UPI003D75E778